MNVILIIIGSLITLTGCWNTWVGAFVITTCVLWFFVNVLALKRSQELQHELQESQRQKNLELEEFNRRYDTYWLKFAKKNKEMIESDPCLASNALHWYQQKYGLYTYNPALSWEQNQRAKEKFFQRYRNVTNEEKIKEYKRFGWHPRCPTPLSREDFKYSPYNMPVEQLEEVMKDVP